MVAYKRPGRGLASPEPPRGEAFSCEVATDTKLSLINHYINTIGETHF